MQSEVEKYMKLALKEAEKAKKKDEVPVGAVIVRNGKIIAKAHNLREYKQKAYAHAEFLVIQKASEKLKTWCLDDCDLYVTLEPCMMCAGIIFLSRINHLYYGTVDQKGGMIESLIQKQTIRHINSYPRKITSGLLQKECAEILTDFFRKKRKLKKEKKNLLLKNLSE